jgi:hypothetical protein
MMPDRNGYAGDERRQAWTEFAEWRKHVDARLDKQDATLQEIRNMLGASKLGLAAIKWFVTIGASIVAILTFTGKLK